MTGKLLYKVKDLILAAQEGEVNVIAQQCNCFNARKRGIAPLIDKAFPEAAKADDSTVKGDKSKFGNLSFAFSEEFRLYIFNLYGQWGYWKRQDGLPNTDLVMLANALIKMKNALRSLKDFHETKIGLCKLGAGLGGADWSIIENIIKDTLCKNGYDVTVYVLDEAEIPENATVIK